MIKILSSSEFSSNLLTFIKKVKKSDKKLKKSIVMYGWHWYITGIKEQEIRKYDWGGCHWLQKKWNQNRDEHQNGITAIPTSVAAFFILYLWMYTQPDPPSMYVGLAVLRQCIQAATDVGIAVIPLWCSSQFWFHFFCSQWEPPQSFSYFLFFVASDVSVSSLHHNTKVFCLIIT